MLQYSVADECDFDIYYRSSTPSSFPDVDSWPNTDPMDHAMMDAARASPQPGPSHVNNYRPVTPEDISVEVSLIFNNLHNHYFFIFIFKFCFSFSRKY